MSAPQRRAAAASVNAARVLPVLFAAVAVLALQDGNVLGPIFLLGLAVVAYAGEPFGRIKQPALRAAPGRGVGVTAGLLVVCAAWTTGVVGRAGGLPVLPDRLNLLAIRAWARDAPPSQQDEIEDSLLRHALGQPPRWSVLTLLMLAFVAALVAKVVAAWRRDPYEFGFDVEHRPPARLRYVEGPRGFTFDADYLGEPRRLLLPSAAAWDSVVPPWLRDRRALVAERLRRRTGYTIVTDDSGYAAWAAAAERDE